MRVQVVRALVDAVDSVDLELPEQALVADALAASGLQDPAIAGYAVYGERVSLETPLRDGDRLELLRPLVIDPKEARRRRALDQREGRPGQKGGQQKRPR